jgi:hypothetical protein
VFPFQSYGRAVALGQVGHDRRQPAAGKHPCKNKDEHDDDQAKQNFFSRAHVRHLDVGFADFPARVIDFAALSPGVFRR